MFTLKLKTGCGDYSSVALRLFGGALCLLCVPLLFCSCFEGLQPAEPLTDPRMELVDEQLLGRWELVDPTPFDKLDPNAIKVRIVKADEPTSKGMMRFECSVKNGKEESIQFSSLMTASQIGKEKFLNVFTLVPTEELMMKAASIKPYSLQEWREAEKRELNVVKYRVDKDELKITNYGEPVRKQMKKLMAADPKLSAREAVLRTVREADESNRVEVMVITYRRVGTNQPLRPID